MQQFIDNACKILEDIRPDLIHITDDLCRGLEGILGNNKINVIGRVKSKESLKEKIIRKNYFDKYEGNAEKLIYGLSDLIGIRINCLLGKEENEIYDIIKSLFDKSDEGNKDFFYSARTEVEKFQINLRAVQPEKQKNGHDIYRIDARYKIDDKFYHIEIQIKSSINALWGEIEHKLFYKNYEYLIDQEFYSDIMGALLNNLDAVEKQLELIQSRLEDSCDQVEETEQILSKLLYNQYNSQLKVICNDCKLDFRDIYKLVSEFYNSTPGCIHKSLKAGIDAIGSNKEIIIDGFIGQLSTTQTEPWSEYVRKLGCILDKGINGHEIYWKVYMYLYNILFKEDGAGWNYVQLVKKISDKMIEKIDILVNSRIEMGQEVLPPVIRRVTIEYFDENKQLAMFLKENLRELYSIIEAFIELNRDKFKPEEIEGIRENDCLDKYIKLILGIVNKNQLSITDIEVIKKLQNDWEYKIVEEDDQGTLNELIQRDEIKQADAENIMSLICGKCQEVKAND